ncbi:MAG: hypothetical protein ACRELB_10500 [Polyangiaceae bacterium]
MTAVVGRVFVVRWVRFSLAALQAVRGEISTARGLLDRRLVYLSLIPSTPRSFSGAERDALAAYVRDLLVHDCASIHHVIEGTGFAVSARRSIVTNLAVAAARPELFHTYASFGDALLAIAGEVGEPGAGLVAELKRRDLGWPLP